VVTIGDIGVTQTQVVTPNGTAPLHGSQWLVNDQSITTERIPTWAIVCAVVFAFLCLLSLLLLLVKEPVTIGYVNVTVRSGELVHTTQIPASNPAVAEWARSTVSYVQSLAAQSA
jgi:hypothetical protein